MLLDKKKVLSNIINLANKTGFDIVALIKPQFEAGKEQVGKNGIVKDKSVHYTVIKNIIDYCADINLYPNGLTFSPITGTKGNIEYLIHLSPIQVNDTKINIEEVINNAQNLLINSKI